MDRAIMTCFHKYTPFGGKYYEPMLDNFIQTMRKYEDEYDRIYILDSTWNMDDMKVITSLPKASITKIDPNIRYYDAYKKTVPTIPERYVLLLDDDMIIYRKGIIQRAFDALSLHAVASIYDKIGEFKTDKMNGKNKLCPYFFAARTDVLKEYTDIDWGPNMPHYETLGLLTQMMLTKGKIIPYEFEEDKSNIYFDGVRDAPKSKDLGYYHVRAGSTPAYLLATRAEGDIRTYRSYIRNQPQREYLRQFAWYWIMGGNTFMDHFFLEELSVNYAQWLRYIGDFRQFHGLIWG